MVETSLTPLSRFTGEDYSSLLVRLQGQGSHLVQLYEVIKSRMADARSYVNTWYSYQALWDMDMAKGTRCVRLRSCCETIPECMFSYIICFSRRLQWRRCWATT